MCVGKRVITRVFICCDETGLNMGREGGLGGEQSRLVFTEAVRVECDGGGEGGEVCGESGVEGCVEAEEFWVWWTTRWAYRGTVGARRSHS